MSISNRWWTKDGHLFQPTTGTEGKVGEIFPKWWRAFTQQLSEGSLVPCDECFYEQEHFFEALRDTTPTKNKKQVKSLPLMKFPSSKWNIKHPWKQLKVQSKRKSNIKLFRAEKQRQKYAVAEGRSLSQNASSPKE